MTTATEKYKWIERKGQSLCAWFTQFRNSQNREFTLEILPPGDYGVWRWTGGEVAIPAEKSWELGEFMTGLRSCLDNAVYEMSRHAVNAALVNRSTIRFPILHSSESWKTSTVSWLNQTERQRVRQAQRFGEHRKYDVDIGIINALANCDKHRSLVRVSMRSASCGQIGGKNGISFSRAEDLGLGPRSPQGWYTASTVQGFNPGMPGKDKFVTGGPLGGLAITGTIPRIELHVANDLDLDDEDAKKRLAQVSIEQVIKQAMYEVKDILGILVGGVKQATEQEVTDAKINDHMTTIESAVEALQIYQNIPLEQSRRSGWSMRLGQLGDYTPDTA